MLIQEPIHAAIWHCLNHYAYSDAVFLAECLFHEVGSDESLFLLATCYYRSGKVNQAYYLLHTQGARTPQNKFLLAKCCGELKKFAEAETLFPPVSSEDQTDELLAEFADAASFALQIIGQIYAETERNSQAVSAERQALKLNPFLWKTFESLCRHGDNPDASKIFTLANVENFVQSNGLNPILSYANSRAVSVPTQAGGPAKGPHLFVPHGSTGSVTSTPINSGGSGHHQQKVIECTPQQGIPVPQFMTSMITPVQNHLDSNFTGQELCFTGTPIAESSRMVSGIAALNTTTEPDTTNPSTVVCSEHLAPPAAPHVRRKRFAQPNASVNTSLLNATTKASGMPVFNLNKFLGIEGSSLNSDKSFGVLPSGTLSWSSQGIKINPEPLSIAGARGVKLDFSSLAVLSPFSPAPVQQSAMTPVPTVDVTPSSHAVALSNTANSDAKLSKKGLTESNAINYNVFTPSSQNNLNTMHHMTPHLSTTSGSSATGGGTNSSSIQNVRRSSRLFVSSQQSKSKENSKGLNSVPVKPSRALRSPSTKSSKIPEEPSSNRLVSNVTRQGGADLAYDKNEKNKPIKQTKEASAVTTVHQYPCHFEQTSQVLGAQALVIQRHSADGLLQLLQQLGTAYFELSKFNCRRAIELLQDLPSKHRKTAWVNGLFGKAYFEMGQYKEAKRYFQDMRKMDPYRMEFAELFSTTLWHLQDEVGLSALAQELTRLDRLSPQAWCAAGNCFSRQKEHENSIKFFNRAIQIDPKFAYGYTLLGHEYVVIEELERALSCFRAAVRADPSHYNAWYGIGLTYYKQERHRSAEYYYRKAAAINPDSPILMCHVAVVQHSQQKTEQALETLNKAIAKAPENPLCKFEKASILFSCERYQEALAILDQLKSLSPKESSIYFLLGRVHSKLNNTHLALMYFSWATDLDPKVANSQIRDALDPILNHGNQDESNDQLQVDDIGDETTNDDVAMMQQDGNASIENEVSAGPSSDESL